MKCVYCGNTLTLSGCVNPNCTSRKPADTSMLGWPENAVQRVRKLETELAEAKAEIERLKPKPKPEPEIIDV